MEDLVPLMKKINLCLKFISWELLIFYSLTISPNDQSTLGKPMFYV